MTVGYAPDTLTLPKAIGKQPEWLSAQTDRKLLRVGRRGSKTRFAMIAGIAGHGEWTDSKPQYPGILQGVDILWVAVDYPQLTTVLWREELVPRFQDLSWATLNGQDHTLSLKGLGTMFLRSSEALRGVRGMGKKLGGVIIDEAAHFDLEGALLNEVLPTLLDNGGWLVIMSTTNAGPDGNSDKRVPSFFNQICEGIRSGDPRFKGWQEFYGTAFDNPRIRPEGIEELISLYPVGSPALEQEVYARLLKAGVGLALSELDADHHLVDPPPVPDYWSHFGSFDWGYNHPWVFCHFVVDTDGNVYLADTMTGRGDEPDEIARKIKLAFDIPAMKGIHAGHDIWQQKGKSIGFKGPTIQEVLWAHKINCTKASIDRVQGLNNFRAYVHWKATETSPEKTPRFRIFNNANNRLALAQLQQIQIDPDNLEDALKVDADAGGKGGDDYYDAIRYGLASRPISGNLEKKYTFKDEVGHRDPNVVMKPKTKDGKPARWIGPGDEGSEYGQNSGGFTDMLPEGI